jgi:hypothetical protein
MNNAPIFQQQARTAENTPISTESQQNGEFNWYKVSTLALLKLEIADIAKINNNIINIHGLPLALISGFLITWTDGFFYPEIIATCFVAIGLILALTMVQETLHESSKR